MWWRNSTPPSSEILFARQIRKVQAVGQRSEQMKTIILENKTVPRKPIVIEGLPGLGSVGKIAASYVAKQLRAKKIATLYSPHFPYHAITERRGIARLPKNDFYHCKSRGEKMELVIITGDCQPQTPVGQYEVADEVVKYAEKYSAKLVVTIGGYGSSRKAELKVIGAATSIRLIDQLKKTGVIVDRAGIPIVGVAGLVLALAKSKGLEALCLLGETTGYTPDPGAAKNVLQILARLLRLDIDLLGMSYEMEKVKAIEARIKEAEKAVEESSREWKVAEKFSYIS